MTEPSEPSEPSGQDQHGNGPSEESERRRRVMERLAEMLQGPPPDRGGASGPVAGGSVEQAIAELGLGLSAEDAEEVAGALRQGPDPEEAAALFRSLLEGFQAWQRRPSSGDGPEEGS